MHKFNFFLHFYIKNFNFQSEICIDSSQAVFFRTYMTIQYLVLMGSFIISSFNASKKSVLYPN